ncbi:MAG: GxGYxYP family putative glycoside hydrolase, partial [Armatimonadota bacterium]|nr:GxGYxYP family putative glycoside hydrolase [Armatimonadota bacterium]
MTSRLPSLLCLIALFTPTQPAFAAADPPPLFVADITYADPAQSLLAVTLQGLANSHPDGPRVFLLANPRDAEWLDYCLRLAPRSAQFLTVPELLEILRPELVGQILYDPDQPYTLDIATTAAGIHQSVISPTDLGLPTILDLRGRWRSAAEAYRWAAESLLPKCSRNKAALLPPDVIAMRDFAVQERLFTLSPPPSPDSEVLGDILSHLSPGAAIYGAAPPPLRP